MRRIVSLSLLTLLVLVISQTAQAGTIKITSGQLFIGGGAYGSPTYQNYFPFEMTGKSVMPRRDFLFDVEQTFAVFQGHPERPKGRYEYDVKMPYHGSRFGINNEIFFPVWYECRWQIIADVVTPPVTESSPESVIVRGPFTMNGPGVFNGAVRTGFRVSGRGIVEIKFERAAGNKYHMREARYLFGTSAPAAPIS